MNKSETITELSIALSGFQSEMQRVPFNSENPFLHNRYADLGACIEASRALMTKYGLAVSQLVTNDGPMVGIETVLMHKSGEWMSSIVTMYVGDEKGKSQAQVAGSIITYMRRYSFQAILGLYAEEETDGNTQGAQRPTGRQQAARQPAQPAKPQYKNPATKDLYENHGSFSKQIVENWTKLVEEAKAAKVDMIFDIEKDDTKETLTERAQAIRAQIAWNTRPVE